MGAVKPLRVALPLGIGDCHWACMKLRALKELHPGRPLHAYVNRSPNHLSVGYLKLVPFIDKALESPDAPFDVVRQMPPSHQNPRWSQLDGCAGWGGFDYIAVANGHLETGQRIETWWASLETDYSYELQISESSVGKMAPWEGRVLLYVSGVGPNHGFHRNSWTPAHWAGIIKRLNDIGVTPVLVGANTKDDQTYAKSVLEAAEGASIDSIVGVTTVEDYCQVIKTASCWIGLNSGGGIVSAMQQTPTVMLWSDSAFPIAGVHSINLPLHTAMRTSWLSEEQLTTYRTASFGDPKLSPEQVVTKVLEVRRT